MEVTCQRKEEDLGSSHEMRNEVETGSKIQNVSDIKATNPVAPVRTLRAPSTP